MKIIETGSREIRFVLRGHCQNLLDDPHIHLCFHKNHRANNVSIYAFIKTISIHTFIKNHWENNVSIYAFIRNDRQANNVSIHAYIKNHQANNVSARAYIKITEQIM